MAKQIQAYKWSDAFKKLMGGNNKRLNIKEYELCANEWMGAHDSKMIRNFIYTIILFSGGLWAIYEHVWFMAVLLLAFAINSNLKSQHHILMSEIISSQKMLAMLIHNSTQDLAEEENREKIELEVSAFAESHPYFDELYDKISPLISEGMSLEEAYVKALTEKREIT